MEKLYCLRVRAVPAGFMSVSYVGTLTNDGDKVKTLAVVCRIIELVGQSKDGGLVLQTQACDEPILTTASFVAGDISMFGEVAEDSEVYKLVESYKNVKRAQAANIILPPQTQAAPKGAIRTV